MVSPSLAMRVAAASAVAGGVVFFTAEVARRNQELVHAEQQLNLVAHGQLATTRLGHFVLMESSKAALTVVGSNFLGALSPLLAGLLWRRLCLGAHRLFSPVARGFGRHHREADLQKHNAMDNRSHARRSGPRNPGDLASHCLGPPGWFGPKTSVLAVWQNFSPAS